MDLKMCDNNLLYIIRTPSEDPVVLVKVLFGISRTPRLKVAPHEIK